MPWLYYNYTQNIIIVYGVYELIYNREDYLDVYLQIDNFIYYIYLYQGGFFEGISFFSSGMDGILL